MRFFLLTVICAVFIGSAAYAQYIPNWVRYNLINPGNDVTRSVVYNPHTDHILVATRKYGTDVIILDAATGDSLGKMNTAGIAGGTYPINMIDVADDGSIYVSNLCAPIFTPGCTFKVYRYAGETAAPELVLDDALDGGRYGDAFAAVGEGDNIYVYSSGQGNEKMAVLRDMGGSSLSVQPDITLPQAGNARHGISPMAPGGRIWINGADNGAPAPRIIAPDGTVIATVDDSLASAGGSSTITHVHLGAYSIIGVANSNVLSATFRSVRFFEDETGFISFDYFGTDSDSSALFSPTGLVPITNATASLSYDSRRHAMVALMGVNAIGSFSMDSLLKASTPRIAELEVSIDGKNDFFPSDKVGRSSDREMYLTWSEGKVFVGMTGETILDPTFTNYMYIAFDLDPTGPNGTATPPENAGGVSALPFKADVVYKVEPFDQPGFMIGEIFKWDGANWNSTFFDGNLASEGALAYADQGYRKLAEVAAIKNAPGIGDAFSDVSMMAYVAQTGAGGNVLTAFPDANPLGNGVAFTHYYYADSLGSGMFPNDPNYVKRRSGSVGIGDLDPQLLQQYELAQNYPNPFNPETTIRYTLPLNSDVKLRVYDVLGQLVATLADGPKAAGTHEVRFNARNLSSGVYFYRLYAGKQAVAARKMLLMK